MCHEKNTSLESSFGVHGRLHKSRTNQASLSRKLAKLGDPSLTKTDCAMSVHVEKKAKLDTLDTSDGVPGGRLSNYLKYNLA